MQIDMTKRLTPAELAKPISNYTTPAEFTFTLEMTVEEVIHTLQSKKSVRQDEYFYITDKDNTLQGIITTRDLLYSPPKALLAEVAETDVLKVHEEDILEKGLNLLTHHQILVLPVITSDNRFVGVLEVMPHDLDSLYKSKKLQQKHVKEDIFQFIGFSLEQKKLASTLTEFRFRMPWLLCNLVGGLICALIGEAFEMTLDNFVILALFIPLVLTLSESISIQSMTISLRFLHLRNIRFIQVWRRIFVEWKTSLLLGIASGALICGFYFIWSTELMPMVAISTSMVVAMVASATFGALFPIVLHLIRLDPKVAAGPVVLMMADIVTIAIYLSVSTALLY